MVNPFSMASLQRLVSAVTVGPQWGMSWVYDGFGNRTAQNVVKGSAPVQSVSVDMNTNRITTWGYDANGNATSIPGVGTITYDGSNRVKTVGSETYEYDPSNKRIWKNDTYTFWGARGERVGTYSVQLMQYLPEGQQTQVYQLSFVKGTEDWYFGGRRLQVLDRLGSANGTFYPYGEERSSSAANPADKFATYHRDGTGLDYADQRYYHAGSGRFISSDPYQGSAMEVRPSSWNRFTYVEGDPVNVTDRRGLSRDCNPNYFRDASTATLFCPPDGAGGRIDNRICVMDGIDVPCSMAQRAYQSGGALTPSQYAAWWAQVSRPQAPALVVNLPAGTSTTSIEAARAYIAALGLDQLIDVDSVRREANGSGFTFSLLNQSREGMAAFTTFLQSSPYFASGAWGLLHTGDVGWPPSDFRSFTYNTAPFSMQINFGPNGFRFDFDLHNPYQDLLSLWRHMACEVLHLCQP